MPVSSSAIRTRRAKGDPAEYSKRIDALLVGPSFHERFCMSPQAKGPTPVA
jgi:hypothetical protein